MMTTGQSSSVSTKPQLPRLSEAKQIRTEATDSFIRNALEHIDKAVRAQAGDPAFATIDVTFGGSPEHKMNKSVAAAIQSALEKQDLGFEISIEPELPFDGDHSPFRVRISEP